MDSIEFQLHEHDDIPGVLLKKAGPSLRLVSRATPPLLAKRDLEPDMVNLFTRK